MVHQAGAHKDTTARREPSPSWEEFRAAFADAGCFHGIEAVFSDVRPASGKKAMWGAPRSISTDAQRESNSAPFGRPRPDERGFRESTAFYSSAERLRAAVKKVEPRGAQGTRGQQNGRKGWPRKGTESAKHYLGRHRPIEHTEKILLRLLCLFAATLKSELCAPLRSLW